MTTSSTRADLLRERQGLLEERQGLFTECRRQNINLTAQVEQISASNRQLLQNNDELEHLLRQANEENGHLRSLRDRSVRSLQDNHEWIIRTALLAVVLLVVVILVALFAFAQVPIWAVAAALLIGSVAWISFEAYNYFSSPPLHIDGPIFVQNPTNGPTPGAIEARDSWLDSLRRLYV